MRMLKLAKVELAKHNAKLILLGGDQIYSDHPKRRSSLDQHYTSSKLPYGSQHILKWPAAAVRLTVARLRGADSMVSFGVSLWASER